MHVLCFDFDGVICDSAPETALSAWHACAELWPDMQGDLPPPLQQRFCRLRPVLHTGWEAIPLMRLVARSDVTDAQVFGGFGALRDGVLKERGLTGQESLQRFGAVRDRMIAASESRWLALNPAYEGVAGLLSAALSRHEVYVITTKQERFATLLLRHYGVRLAADRVFGLERGRTKPQVLAELLARPALAGRAFHFIEDRLDTLQDVIRDAALNAVNLYLVDWGYNTPDQRKEAAATGRIEVIACPRLEALCAR